MNRPHCAQQKSRHTNIIICAPVSHQLTYVASCAAFGHCWRLPFLLVSSPTRDQLVIPSSPERHFVASKHFSRWLTRALTARRETSQHDPSAKIISATISRDARGVLSTKADAGLTANRGQDRI